VKRLRHDQMELELEFTTHGLRGRNVPIHFTARVCGLGRARAFGSSARSRFHAPGGFIPNGPRRAGSVMLARSSGGRPVQEIRRAGRRSELRDGRFSSSEEHLVPKGGTRTPRLPTAPIRARMQFATSALCEA